MRIFRKLMLGSCLAGTVLAASAPAWADRDDWHRGRADTWHHQDWHRQDWRHDRGWAAPVVVAPPPVYYAPPPAYYAPPPPVYYGSPAITFSFGS